VCQQSVSGIRVVSAWSKACPGTLSVCYFATIMKEIESKTVLDKNHNTKQTKKLSLEVYWILLCEWDRNEQRTFVDFV